MHILSEEIGNYALWQWITVGILLSAVTFQDVKHKSVSIGTLLLTGVPALIICGFLEEDVCKMLIGLIPGMAVIFCAFISREAIGYGDGLVMLITGSLVGINIGFQILMYACLMAAAVSVILLVLKKVKRKTEIVFMPFLAAAFILTGVI